jgi:hypothetical protein
LLRLRNAVSFSSVVVRDLEPATRLTTTGPCCLTAASGTTGIHHRRLGRRLDATATFDTTIAGFRDGTPWTAGSRRRPDGRRRAR